MRRIFPLALLWLFCATGTVQAATLANTQEPIYSGAGSSFFLEPLFDLASVSGTVETFTFEGSTETALTDFDITGFFDATDRLSFAALSVFEATTSQTDGNDLFLTGDLVETTDFGPTWELLFDVTGGEAARLYGRQALVTLTNISSTVDPFTNGVSGTGDVSISAVTPPAVIPLPASLPLLLVGVAGLTAITRRRRCT